MAQAFVTTYLTEYRWQNQARTLPIHQENLNRLELKGDIWITNFGIAYDEKSSDYDSVKQEIYKMHMKRMRSTYQREYCDIRIIMNINCIFLGKNVSKTSFEMLLESGQADNLQEAALTTDEEEEEHNELFESCKNLYDKEKNEKILPPLEGARTVFGYLRPSRLRVPYTIYQGDYGKIGYNVLKSNLQRKVRVPEIKNSNRCY